MLLLILPPLSFLCLFLHNEVGLMQADLDLIISYVVNQADPTLGLGTVTIKCTLYFVSPNGRCRNSLPT